MKTVEFEGATRVLAKPPNWDDSKHGTCGALAIRDERHPAGNSMTSYWKPSAEELRLLNEGYAIRLTILGYVHPPVSVGVDKV